MQQLKFSHMYLKLPPNWEGKKATLLFVREIELERQMWCFLDYDTAYTEGTKGKENFGNYPLPKKGKYLLGLFDCEGTVFTALRRSTPQKLRYYGDCIDLEFELVRA